MHTSSRVLPFSLTADALHPPDPKGPRALPLSQAVRTPDITYHPIDLCATLLTLWDLSALSSGLW